MIYGYSLVEVTKQPNNLRWLVSSVEGKELVAIPWRLVFDQSELVVNAKARYARDQYDQDRLTALGVSMLMCPLNEQDLVEFGRKYPGLVSKPPWVPDRTAMAWIPQEFRPRGSRREPENRGSPSPSIRSTPEPRPVEEVVQADPERKLLF